jgi:hypothetical protein
LVQVRSAGTYNHSPCRKGLCPHACTFSELADIVSGFTIARSSINERIYRFYYA